MPIDTLPTLLTALRESHLLDDDQIEEIERWESGRFPQPRDLTKAIELFDLRTVISFHDKVEGARKFSASLEPIAEWMPSRQRPTGVLRAQFVSGRSQARKRAIRLSRLSETGENALHSGPQVLVQSVKIVFMAPEYALEKRISQHFLKLFLDGFPDQTLELIYRHFLNLHSVPLLIG